jgi:hypothetical protein
MRIQLRSTPFPIEIRNNSITKTQTSPYIEQREVFWEEKLKAVQARGAQIWNGDIYYLDALEVKDNHIYLDLGVGSFKDLAFLIDKGTEYISSNLAESDLSCYATVLVFLKTVDGKYIFPVTNGSTYQESGKVHVLGGNLNRDEVQISSIDDIYQQASNEISEETNLTATKDLLQLDSIFINNSRCNFIFTYNHLFEENEIANISRNTELGQFKSFTKEEYLMDGKNVNKSVEAFMRKYKI